MLGDTFAYDANGNLTVGLGGKVMAHDGENQPLQVAHAGDEELREQSPIDGFVVDIQENSDMSLR
ncbi:MAG: hypothetical protein AAFR93_14525, partial [Pseudomonadota bacterium]